MRRGRPEPIQKAISLGVECFRLLHLREAAKYGNCRMVNALLGAKNVVDEWRSSPHDASDPFCLALAQGYTDTARLLLDYTRNRHFGHRAWLHEAARLGNLSFIMLLLRAGIDASAVNELGITSLWYAVEAGQAEACRVLLEHGASPDQDNTKTPLTCHQKAARKGYADIVDLPLHHDASLLPVNDTEGPLILATESGSGATIEHLIRGCCSVTVEEPVMIYH